MKKDILNGFIKIGIATLAFQFASAAETNLFLQKQKEFNSSIYSAHSENVKIAQRGSFTRANFATVDATLNDEHIIASLIEKRILPAAQILCRRNIVKCAAAIVKKDRSILPSIELAGVLQLTELFKSWNLSETWTTELTKIEELLKEHLNSDFTEYVIGYNDNSEIFNYVLLSKDRTRAIVLTGALSNK